MALLARVLAGAYLRHIQAPPPPSFRPDVEKREVSQSHSLSDEQLCLGISDKTIATTAYWTYQIGRFVPIMTLAPQSLQ